MQFSQVPPPDFSKRVHYNRPQLAGMLIDANEETNLWGRATGKSEGRLSVRTLTCVQQMPRSAGVNVAKTYLQILDRTLPPILKHWQDLGMHRDVDFWVRKFPDKKWGLELPYFTPETPEHAVFVRSNKNQVALMRLVSQDRPGSSNGLSIDWIVGDEARFLNKQRYDDELVPTNRGNERYFAGSYLHHSVCLCSDMPNSPEGYWLFEKEKGMDKEAVALVKGLNVELYRLNPKNTPLELLAPARARKIVRYRKELNQLRAKLSYYSEASTLENIDVLRESFFEKQKKQLPDYEYDRAILNNKPQNVKEGFYSLLGPQHKYNAIDYSVVDGLSEKDYGTGKLNNCKKDADLNRAMPLHAAPDFGGSINFLSVGQPDGNCFRFLKNVWVKNPQRVKDLAKAFNDYYRYFYKKELFFYFDHTHIKTESVADKNPKDEFVNDLETLGWTVHERYLGHTPSSYTRFNLWSFGFVGDDPRVMYPLFNEDNFSEGLTSMQNTRIKRGAKDPYAKDKGLEGDKEADQLLAPHGGDSADILYFGVHKELQYQGFTIPESFTL
ncbi:hypothetical protein DTQ70_03990 [Runella sp. SP2]|nr:hypothetical protein DTQ70_03990 [Runella sp. SP2]